MNRILQIGGICLLAAGASFGDQKAPKDTSVPAAANAPFKGGTPKAGIPKGARMVNPANVATRLFRMSPEDRDRALEKLGPKQQENARNLLAWFDDLPKEQQQVQLRRMERFEKLTPEKKLEVRDLFTATQQLLPMRKRVVVQTLWTLQNMTDQEREATLKRPFFQNRFSPDELKIITGLADAWMGPR